jgi:hypothetical protein
MAEAASEVQEFRMQRAVRIVPASPEFVLAALRASHRHQCSVDPEAEPDVELSFDTTVAAWRNACDLVGTKELAQALNEDWDVAISVAAWKAVLDPPESRTLREVCELIASHATQTEILSVGHFGTSSKAAGAFLAVRSLLLRAGADPRTVRPSLPIADATRHFPSTFLGPISKLAPTKLPTITIRTPVVTAALVTVGVGLLGLFALPVAGWLGFAGWRTELGVFFTAVAALGHVSLWLANRFIRPAEVHFGTIVTFRDLAEVIAGERPDAGAEHIAPV